MGAVLSLRQVRRRRGGREVLAIERLDVEAGERLAVLGPNGAGKTTLLRLLAGLDAPASGTVQVDGVAPSASGPALRRGIGYATQRPGLLSTSVRRNLELPLQWRGLPRVKRRAAGLAALERLGVAHLADRPAWALSGGEAQRVSLARAFALEPALLLLDEPAAGLDAEARRDFLDDMERALTGRDMTVVHVSHRADEALRWADRVAMLVDGALRQLEEPTALLRHPADATVARLVGYHNVVPARVDGNGEVLVAGKRSGLRRPGVSGGATVAAWGAALRLCPPDAAALEATVERVSAGAGRWEIELAGPESLNAHLTLDATPPQPGDRVAVRIEEALATVICRTGDRGAGDLGHRRELDS